MSVIKNMNHGEYQKMIRNKTDAQLQFIVKDAREALDAMPDGPNAGYYKDEMLYAAMELNQRDRVFYAKAAEIIKKQSKVARKLAAAICLSIFLMAGGSEAQVRPEQALPQYLPPSYHSPHGGTGHADFSIPPPKVEWPTLPGPQDPIGNYAHPADPEWDKVQNNIREAKTPEEKEAAHKAFIDKANKESESLRKNMKAWDDMIYNRKGR